MACLYIVRGPDHGAIRPLQGEAAMTIGRSDDADMQLVDERASRVHCKLVPTKEVSQDFGIEVTRWMVEDAGSSNGTRIGSEVITEAAKLADGMVIGLGQTSIVYLDKSFENADEAKARCEALGIDESTLTDHAWPMSNPADSGTLNTDS